MQNTGTGAKDTVLRYQGPQGPEELEVLAGQIVTKEIIFATNVQPATVEIKAFDKTTNIPVRINDKESVLVNPTTTKVTTDIVVSAQGN